MSYYIPKGTHGTLMNPRTRAIRHWKAKLPLLFGESDVAELPTSDPWWLNKIGFKTEDGHVFMIARDKVLSEVPEDFGELLEQAEWELEEAQTEMGYSPFR